MKEVQEKLSVFVDRIERLKEQYAKKNIIISTSLRKREFLLDGDDERIRKEPIIWPLYQHNLFYVVTVPAGTKVRKHKHDEDLFRFIASGSLLLNKKHKIRAGTWFVVRAGTPYEIETPDGYVSIAAYTSICQTNRGTFGSHLLEGS